MSSQWTGLLAEVGTSNIQVKREGNNVTIAGTGVPPLELTLTGDSLRVDATSGGKDYRMDVIEEGATALRLRIFPWTAQNMKGSAYNERQRYLLQPWNVTVRIVDGRLRDARATTYFNHGQKEAR